jgi:hypothetical protein
MLEKQNRHIKIGCIASTIGAHLRSDPRWKAASKVVLMADRKRRHQFFNTSLAKGTFHLGIMAHDELIKFVAAVFAVIFINRHGFPPYFK